MSRLEMEGALQELKLRKMNLAISANSRIKAIKNSLALASVTPLHEIDIDEVALLATELKDLKDEYLDVLEKIKRLERELGKV